MRFHALVEVRLRTELTALHADEQTVGNQGC